VSNRYVVLGIGDEIAFYIKTGRPYPSSNNTLTMDTLFAPLVAQYHLDKDANGHIDSINDLRVVFDPFRKHFVVLASGAYRSKVNGEKGYLTLPLNQRRLIQALAVSVDQNPAHGWYLYFWDAAVGWGTNQTPYIPGDMADYPTLGVSPTTIDVSIKVGSSSTREYPHVSMWPAHSFETGQGPTVNGWSLYPTTTGGFRNPDGSMPGVVVQPTMAHGDAWGSYFLGREGDNELVVWKVTNQLKSNQTLVGTTVTVPTSWHDPADAPQKGSPTSFIIMSNLGTYVLKSVWRLGYLYAVTTDADGSGRAMVRLLRIPAPTYPIPSVTEFLIGDTAISSYGWPSLEVNRNGDAVVVYTRAGITSYAGIRYNVWKHNESALRSGWVLKEGEGPTSETSRWGDLAGASVDFNKDGTEGKGIWIFHEYAKKDGTYGTWAGKIFGATYKSK
jgi:hypothetical protein